MKVEMTLLAIVIVVVVGLVAFLVAIDVVCPHGQTYQVTKYEPYFDAKGQPAYRPVFECK